MPEPTDELQEQVDTDASEANAAEVETEVRDEETTESEDQGGDVLLERRQRIARDLEGTTERRQFTVSGVELRQLSDEKTLRFTGYASTTEVPYEVADFTETVARGAFKRTLTEAPDVVFLVNHEGLPLARTKSGTLTLAEDARGLRVDADFEPADPDVQAIMPKIQRGDLDSMSFAFRVTAQKWNDDYTERVIRGVSLHQGDVSIVTMAANPDTAGTVALRSEDGEFELRVGAKHSAATKAELLGMVDVLKGMVAEPEPTPSAEEVAAGAHVEATPLLNETARAAQELDLMEVRRNDR